MVDSKNSKKGIVDKVDNMDKFFEEQKEVQEPTGPTNSANSPWSKSTEEPCDADIPFVSLPLPNGALFQGEKVVVVVFSNGTSMPLGKIKSNHLKLLTLEDVPTLVFYNEKAGEYAYLNWAGILYVSCVHERMVQETQSNIVKPH